MMLIVHEKEKVTLAVSKEDGEIWACIIWSSGSDPDRLEKLLAHPLPITGQPRVLLESTRLVLDGVPSPTVTQLFVRAVPVVREDSWVDWHQGDVLVWRPVTGGETQIRTLSLGDFGVEFGDQDEAARFRALSQAQAGGGGNLGGPNSEEERLPTHGDDNPPTDRRIRDVVQKFTKRGNRFHHMDQIERFLDLAMQSAESGNYSEASSYLVDADRCIGRLSNAVHKARDNFRAMGESVDGVVRVLEGDDGMNAEG